ncbi:hypothetical protein [Pararhizobium qamdonense]|uniref:hypothetical protein n=1 Tax=Pararhizobium qamdonense TaxID=3031126 RepID=UPI0023E1DC11|nr:hypothetical protein [Pararhizobium qamdonense]
MTEEIILPDVPAPIKPATNSLNEVYSIEAIDAHGETYSCEVNLTDRDGETYDATHIYRASDPYGLSPILKEWVLAHPDFPIANYVEPPAPTAEELRARMPSITPRQLRLTLVRNGFSLASVTTAIAALPEGPVKDEVQIEWEYSTSFDRLSPTLLAIADSLNLRAESVDELWSMAAAA